MLLNYRLLSPATESSSLSLLQSIWRLWLLPMLDTYASAGLQRILLLLCELSALFPQLFAYLGMWHTTFGLCLTFDCFRLNQLEVNKVDCETWAHEISKYFAVFNFYCYRETSINLFNVSQLITNQHKQPTIIFHSQKIPMQLNFPMD